MKNPPTTPSSSRASSGCTCGSEACSLPTLNTTASSSGGRRFFVSELDCPEEVEALRHAVGPVVGGSEQLSFNLLTREMLVRVSDSQVGDQDIVTAVRRAGLSAVPAGSNVRDQDPHRRRRFRLALTAVSGSFLLIGAVIHGISGGGWLQALGLAETSGGAIPTLVMLLYLAAAISGVWCVVGRALASMRSLRPDMNLLMVIAVSGALVIGQWMEAATVAFLFSASLLIESWSVGRARHAVEQLMALAPTTASIRLPTGSEKSLAPEAVSVGDIVVVRAGERLPLDGEVVEGRALLDTSPLTGESQPVLAELGEQVYAGSISLDGTLEIRVTHPSSDTVLARIIHRVAEAGRRRAPSERKVDRFARVYTPAIFVAAVMTAVLPPLAGLGAWGEWTYRALVLLVIGCPCALVISTPVAVVASLAAAARHGVLIKGGDLVEVPAHVVAVAFDKTGTLTTGEPQVAEVLPWGDTTPADVLTIASSLEMHSNHPLGAALVQAARDHGLDPAPARDVRIVAGRGMEGLVEGDPAWVGSHGLATDWGYATPSLSESISRMAAGGRTVVVVGRRDRVCGLISLSDAPRPEAAEAVKRLRQAGVRKIAMLTGDNLETAEEVGRAVGISEVHAGLLPDDKTRLLMQLRSAGPLAFVGDGINDAPALAMADIGIAMGAGTDAALETAHAALVSSDLTRLPWLVRHSRRTLGIIGANITFALGIKAVFVILTFLGHASLWAAIAADMGASLLVTFNSLRILSPSRRLPGLG